MTEYEVLNLMYLGFVQKWNVFCSNDFDDMAWF